NVGGGEPRPLRDDHVTAAEAAPLTAKRKVDVDRERLLRVGGRLVELLEVSLRREALVELDRRGIRGVARAGAVVLGEEVRGDGGDRRVHRTLRAASR